MKWENMLSLKNPSTFAIWSFDKKKNPNTLQKNFCPSFFMSSDIKASDLPSQKRTQAKNKHPILPLWLRWLLAQQCKTTCPASDQRSISASTQSPTIARNTRLWGCTSIGTNTVWHFPAIFFQLLTVCGSGASFGTTFNCISFILTCQISSLSCVNCHHPQFPGARNSTAELQWKTSLCVFWFCGVFCTISFCTQHQ